MSDRIGILIVEGSPADADLVERAIDASISPCEFLRVDSRQSFQDAIETFRPDAILCVHGLPQFDALNALALVLEKCPDTPFIIVTGSVGEDKAVECMKFGAWDYVIKGHLKRLAPAVANALEQKRIRTARKLAEEALRESEERFAAAFQLSPVSMSITAAATSQFVEANEMFFRTTGYDRQEVIGHTPEELQLFYDPIDRKRLIASARNTGGAYSLEIPFRIKNGNILHCLVSIQRIQLSGSPNLLCTSLDITLRKHAEQQLAEQLDELRTWQTAMLGREDRVQELKREVNELCRRLADPIRYPSQEGIG